MDKEDLAEYMRQLVYNEENRLSYNERQENWNKYLREKQSNKK